MNKTEQHKQMCDNLRLICTRLVNMFFEIHSRLPSETETLTMFKHTTSDVNLRELYKEYVPLVYKIEMCTRMINGEIKEMPKRPPKKEHEQIDVNNVPLENYLAVPIENILENLPNKMSEEQNI